MVIVRRDSAAEARVPSFEQMRASLVKEIREQAVDPVFVDKSQKLADISFEASDLVQPAETLGLKIEKSDLFGREGGAGIAANKAVVAAAFSDDVINLGANSDLIELSPGQVMVLRVNEHKKAERKALADVRGEVEAQLRQQKAEEQLEKTAGELVKQLAGGADVAAVAKGNDLTWDSKEKVQRFSRDVPAQVIGEAFKMAHPAKDASSFASVNLPNGDLAVVRVSKVQPGTEVITKDQLRMMGANLAVRNGTHLFDEYVQNLRVRANVKVNAGNDDNNGEG